MKDQKFINVGEMTLYDWMITNSENYRDRKAAEEELNSLTPKYGESLDELGSVKTRKDGYVSLFHFNFPSPYDPLLDGPQGLTVLLEGDKFFEEEEVEVENQKVE